MRSTIDSGGRVVIPKGIRERIGLAPGSVVEVTEHDGRVEISPAEAPVHLVEVDGVVVARSAAPLPPLTDEVVRETLERTRR